MKLALDHWHIEVSSKCTLKCPRCPRVEVPDNTINKELSLAFFKERLGEDLVRQMKKVTFCGNDGDPIYCKELLEIIQWIKTVNPNIHLIITTNGSYKSPDWWRALASILNTYDEVQWSIDGWDQASNNEYRVNSNWASIISGIDAFVEANKVTYTNWCTIGFKFNQDHMDEIKQLAQTHGMDCFQLTKSSKFGAFNAEAYGEDDPLQPDSEFISPDNRYTREYTNLTEKVRPSDSLLPMFKKRATNLIASDYSGICLIGNKGVFLNANGEFYPCCWTALRYEHNSEWVARSQGAFNLYNTTFTEVIADKFWTTEFLEFDSFECKFRCTKNKLSDENHTINW